MELSEALARTSINRLAEFTTLSDILEPDIIESCLQSNGVATLRKRKLPKASHGCDGLDCRRNVTV